MLSFCCSLAYIVTTTCTWWSVWDVSFGADVILNLSSWSRLGSTLSLLRSAMFTLRWVIIFFWDNDLSSNIKSSLGNLNVLGFLFTTTLGFTDFSLIGDGVFIGNNNILSTNLSLGTSRFWSELSIITTSFSTWELYVNTFSKYWTRWNDFSTSTTNINSLKFGGSDGGNKKSNNEFHGIINLYFKLVVML